MVVNLASGSVRYWDGKLQERTFGPGEMMRTVARLGLFVAQRDHGVQTGDAARRQIGSSERNNDNEKADGGDREWVHGTDPEQQGL